MRAVLLSLITWIATGAALSAAAPAANVRALTGAPTRIVWVQDVGDNSDVFLKGQSLRLMGLDTEDGRGERAILAGPDNFAKPMFTADGSRVVFSNRQAGTMHVVNWDGSGRRSLGRGMALAVWRDPATRVEWIYFAAPGPDDTYRDVRRIRLDGRGTSERIWNAEPVGEDFQVSRDGARIASVFPWPRCGLALIRPQTYKRVGTGCWTSLAPDASNRMWCFDNTHRALTITDTASSKSWRVVVNGAPGVNGREVYHPRWSNDVRFMVITGPYAVGNGQNRIRGGGPQVELHIGRFTPDLSKIEAWTTATSNDRADFYPDVWIGRRD